MLVRHGESETAARGIVGGDAPLTERGRVQARELRRELAAYPFDLCLTSGALRARETAALALAERDVRIEVVRELGDIAFGEFDGKPLDVYRDWIASHSPAERAPGGESRVDTLRRFTRALRDVLARPEAHVLVVGHGLMLSALQEERPSPIVAGVRYGSFLRLTRRELERALARVERWCEAPAW